MSGGVKGAILIARQFEHSTRSIRRRDLRRPSIPLRPTDPLRSVRAQTKNESSSRRPRHVLNAIFHDSTECSDVTVTAVSFEPPDSRGATAPPPLIYQRVRKK